MSYFGLHAQVIRNGEDQANNYIKPAAGRNHD